MRAHAAITTELTPGGRTRVSCLRSQAPLMLRLTDPKGPEPWTANAVGPARVCLAAGAAGPIGGDEFALTVDVGAGSTLVLRDIAATLLLPGPHGEQSLLRTTIRIGDGATFVWLPEPVIAARRCSHRTEVRIELETSSRLILREELLLGRHGEPPGAVEQCLRVRIGGRPLLHQQLAVGPGREGWDSAAVTAGRRAVGSLLVVDPAWTDDPPAPALLGDAAATMPLAGPAVLVSAVATDALALRRQLDRGLAGLVSTAPAALVAP